MEVWTHFRMMAKGRGSWSIPAGMIPRNHWLVKGCKGWNQLHKHGPWYTMPSKDPDFSILFPQYFIHDLYIFRKTLHKRLIFNWLRFKDVQRCWNEKNLGRLASSNRNLLSCSRCAVAQLRGWASINILGWLVGRLAVLSPKVSQK